MNKLLIPHEGLTEEEMLDLLQTISEQSENSQE